MFFGLLSGTFGRATPSRSVAVHLRLFSITKLRRRFPNEVDKRIQKASQCIYLSMRSAKGKVSSSSGFRVFSPFCRKASRDRSGATKANVKLDLMLSVIGLRGKIM